MENGVGSDVWTVWAPGGIAKCGAYSHQEVSLDPSRYNYTLKGVLRELEVLLFHSTYRKKLGLGNQYTEDELKQAWMKFSLEHHPDRNGDPEKFRRGYEAYTKLMEQLTMERNNSLKAA